MRKAWLALPLVMSPVHAGTVFTYVWPDNPATAILVMEVDDGRVRWQWVDNETEWYVFNTADRTITGYRGGGDDEEERLYDIYREDVLEARSTPKRLGKTRRAEHECTMYAFDMYGATEKVCLAPAAALGVPADDAATLNLFADVLHRMQDAGTYSDGLPVGFSGIEGVGVWRSNGTLLSAIAQREVPDARFATPAGYTLYVPPEIHGK